MTLVRRLAPHGLLAALALAFFASLVAHPSRTLYSDHSDLIALHVPWETFLGRAWRASGEQPLWNPLQFAGLPFAHDIQAAISYPPHAIFRFVGEDQVGPALSWLIVAHVVLAGWGTYAYSRATGLGVTAALVSAMGFMFGGKWMLHLLLAGHYAFSALAWLPWVALGLDQAIRARRPLAAVWAGVALGLMAMACQPQLTLYSGLFLFVWTLPVALNRDVSSVDERPERLGRFSGLVVWIAAGGIAAVVAGGIAAIQLLPSWEAMALSTRGTRGIPENPSFSLRALTRTFGPSPDGVRPVLSWEPRSGLGVVWIAAALIAPIVTTGRARRLAWWGLAVSLGLALFALGGAALFQWVPLFKMFRQPSRMFLIAAFPLAWLAGLTTQALLADPGPTRDARLQARRIATRSSIGLIAWLAVSALASGPSNIQAHPYWFSLLVTVPAACWLVGVDPASWRSPWARSGWRLAWCAVLLTDLVAQTWPHVQTRPLNEVLAPSAIARAAADRAGPLGRVLDRNLPGHQSNTPLGPAVATSLGLHQWRGYNALDLVRYKEYIALTADPIVVGQPYNGLINVPIRHKPLLDLLGVRVLVQPAAPGLRGTDEPDPDLDPRWHRVATDPAPSAFTFAVGGVRTLPPYELLENTEAFPRAFVVPNVARLSLDRPGIVRDLTSTDFRRVALIESPVPIAVEPPPGAFRPAAIRSYQPNRIDIDADGPGLLVLADPWFPGWSAAIDGAPARVERANYLFRAVALPPGRHAVSFAFRPASYRLGRAVSLATAGAVALVTLLGLARDHARRSARAKEV